MLHHDPHTLPGAMERFQWAVSEIQHVSAEFQSGHYDFNDFVAELDFQQERAQRWEDRIEEILEGDES